MIEMLYSTVGVVIGLAYVPQTIKLFKTPTPCYNISLLMWYLWDYTAIVSLTYSLYGQEVFDAKFFTVNAVNTFFITLIILIIHYKRYKYSDIVMISEEDESLVQISDTVEEVEEILDMDNNHPQT